MPFRELPYTHKCAGDDSNPAPRRRQSPSYFRHQEKRITNRQETWYKVNVETWAPRQLGKDVLNPPVAYGGEKETEGDTTGETPVR